MPRYYIDFIDAEQDEIGHEFANAETARNAAIELLGAYLQSHPEFAYAQHWRVDIRDSARRLLFHVIIGTVVAPPHINFASFAS